MDNWKNILDENILKYNVSFAAIFVLNYECLKDYVINQVREFYSDNGKWDGDNYIPCLLYTSNWLLNGGNR